jgi:hypothetical protein
MFSDDLRSNRNEEAIKGTQEYWQGVEKRKARGESTTEEELTRRIAGLPSSTPDRYEKLAEENKLADEKLQKIEELVRKRANANSQSEEEFQKELDKLNSEISRIKSL